MLAHVRLTISLINVVIAAVIHAQLQFRHSLRLFRLRMTLLKYLLHT